jgi:hypothetical protein
MQQSGRATDFSGPRHDELASILSDPLFPFSKYPTARWTVRIGEDPRSALIRSLTVACCVFVASSHVTAQQATGWTIATKPELAIGDAMAEDEYMFQSISAARLLPDGRVVVADNGLLEIRMYGKDGKFLQRIGRRGSGPGEFAYIPALWLTSKGKIAAWDARTRRITIYTGDGNLENTHKLAVSPIGSNIQVYLGSFSNDEVALAALAYGERGLEAAPDRWIIGRFTLDGKFVASLGEVRGMWRTTVIGSVPFSPVPAYVIHRDSLYVAEGFESEIAVRNSRGAVIRKIGLPSAQPVDADAVWATLETRARQRGKKVAVDHLEHGRVDRGDRFPQIGGMLWDDRGYIWIKVYDPFVDSVWLKSSAVLPAAGGEWRVIRMDGSIITTVRMPDAIMPLEIKGNKLLGVATDEFGVERVVVHTIQR